MATEKMEQPSSSKAARPVFVVRPCTRVNASTSVHDYLVLPLTQGGDAALRPFCWRQVSQLYVKADKTDALEDIVEELQIRDLSRKEEGVHQPHPPSNGTTLWVSWGDGQVACSSMCSRTKTIPPLYASRRGYVSPTRRHTSAVRWHRRVYRTLPFLCSGVARMQPTTTSRAST